MLRVFHRDKEEFKNKKAKTSGNESGQHKSNANRFSFQHKQKGPAPSSASAPVPRNKCEYNSQNSQNFRARPAHSQGLRITESTWRVIEESYFAFRFSVLSPEGKDQVGGKREQSAHHREVPRSGIMSPNDPEHEDAEGWCNTVMNYTKGRITELIGDSD
uniref:Gag-pol polyprotein n=1 Tax=Solanum tuberosum TaxID=4113 RepID=M1DGK1_SOLTU